MKEIMTPYEAAEYLNLNIRTILLFVSFGNHQLPGQPAIADSCN